MNTWAKRLLVLMTIGGGFLGFAIMVTQFARPNIGVGDYLILAVLCFGFVFGVVSGFVLVEREREGLLMTAVYLGALVPIVSSPILSYQAASGLVLRIAVVGGRFSFYGGVGSNASVWFFGSQPWGAGVNLAALAALVIAIVQLRKLQRAEPGATDNPVCAPRI